MTLYNGIMASMDEGSAPRTKEMYEYVAQKVDDFGLGKMDVHDPTLADGVSQLIRSIAPALPASWMRTKRATRPREGIRYPPVAGVGVGPVLWPPTGGAVRIAMGRH